MRNEQVEAEVNQLWPIIEVVNEPVQAFDLPYKQSATESFIIIWCYLKHEISEPAKMRQTLISLIESLSHADYIGRYSGVEIVFCYRTTTGESDRLVRVSVEKQAIVSGTIKQVDLEQQGTNKGISVLWYRTTA